MFVEHFNHLELLSNTFSNIVETHLSSGKRDTLLSQALSQISADQQDIIAKHIHGLEQRVAYLQEQLHLSQQALHAYEEGNNRTKYSLKEKDPEKEIWFSLPEVVSDQAKEELIKSEKLYRDFIEYAPMGTIKIGLSGLVKFSSVSAEQIFGYDRHEYINQPVIDRVYKDDQAYFLSLMKFYSQEENRILSGEFRAVRKDGSVIWIKGSGQVKLDEKGKAAYLLVSFLDVTETKQAKHLLSEHEAIYKALVANSREGIDILDVTRYHPDKNPVAKLIIRNDRMVSFLQDKTNPFITAEDFEGIAAEEQLGGITATELFRRAAYRLLEKGFSIEILRGKRPNGDKIDIEAQEQILEVNGKTILIRFYKDITQRVRQEEQIESQLLQLNEQNIDLQTYIQSNMQLENFAYIASHDLRAPIRNIVSFSNLLEKRTAAKLDDAEQEFLKYIVDSAKNMSNLIEDLLTFSRANTNKRELSEIDFAYIVKQVQDDQRAIINKTGAKLIWPQKNIRLTADRIKFYQIFQNLIGNALKFTVDNRPPIITIQFKETKKYWVFSVADNGIGIPAEFSHQIFLIFKRLHTQEEFEGTGIGLAICKKLVEQHNGRIWVESTEGEGSVFYFRIAKNLE